MSISMDLDTKIEANQAFPSSKSTYFKNLFSHNAILGGKRLGGFDNANDHVFQKKKPWKNCEKGPEGEELLEEKKSNG